MLKVIKEKQKQIADMFLTPLGKDIREQLLS